MNRNSSSVLWTVIAGLVIGIMISLASQNIALRRQHKVASVSKFDEVMYYINTDYVDTVHLKEIEEQAIITMMDELDPHSQYISVEEFTLTSMLAIAFISQAVPLKVKSVFL